MGNAFSKKPLKEVMRENKRMVTYVINAQQFQHCFSLFCSQINLFFYYCLQAGDSRTRSGKDGPRTRRKAINHGNQKGGAGKSNEFGQSHGKGEHGGELQR